MKIISGFFYFTLCKWLNMNYCYIIYCENFFERKLKMKKIFWILSLLWMGVIFYFSSQPGKISDFQSDLAIKILNILIKNVDLRDYSRIEFITRKGAHFTLYFILGILFTISIYILIKSKKIHRACLLGLLLSVIYSITDEYHQLFISGRSGSIKDVFIDTIGAVSGIVIIGMILGIRKLIIYIFKSIKSTLS